MSSFERLPFWTYAVLQPLPIANFVYCASSHHIDHACTDVLHPRKALIPSCELAHA